MLRLQSKQKENEGRNINEILRQFFLGKQQIVSFDGVSQYQTPEAGRSASACGLAALNYVRTVFRKEHEGVIGDDLIRGLLTSQSAEEITSICAYWTSPFHLEVDDIIQLPLFSTSFSLVRPPIYYSQCNFTNFRKLLGEVQAVSTTSSVAVIITRPPEIVACLKIHTPRDGDIFIIFDSHPRPAHPRGAGFVLNVSIDEAAKYLTTLFEADKNLLSRDGDRQFQWQVDLMKHFSGHILVSRGLTDDLKSLTQVVMESSMKILALSTEISTLKRENMFITAELEKSQKGFDERKPKNQAAVPGSSSQGRASDSQSSRRPINGSRSKHSRNQLNSLSAAMDRIHISGNKYRGAEDEDHILALQLQRDFDKNLFDTEKALMEQRKYDEEDRRLAAERKALADTFPSIFQCGICFDEHPEDSVARISQCQHLFCRDCIREYIRSKLERHLFPIPCPTCIAEKVPSELGLVNEALIREVGISDKEYCIFEELQISTHSILLHCRKCQETMFVDRQEHQESKILVCPLPGCQHIWCKSCQQTVDIQGPQHSCDGSSELQYLMKQSGWKFCPGCETPIQKESGCNHMTCMSPGCNTHFCYKCGDNIIKSAMPKEIKTATSRHYRRCTLFEH